MGLVVVKTEQNKEGLETIEKNQVEVVSFNRQSKMLILS